MGLKKEAALADIDSVLNDVKNPPFAGSSAAAEFANGVMAECIRRLTPPQSQHREALVRLSKAVNAATAFNMMLGAIHAVRADIEKDRLRLFEELVHSALFDDFLVGAEHLLAENWLLPAAVTAGRHVRGAPPTTCGAKRFAGHDHR
jgi:hypothetical protein